MEGHTIGIDVATLVANAAMRSIVQRATGEAYEGVVHSARRSVGHGNAHCGPTWRGSI